MLLRTVAPTLALTFAGCGLNVFHTQVSGEATIPADPSPVPAVLSAFPSIGSFTQMDFNSNQDFQNQGVTKDQVSSVVPEEVSLTIEAPADADFSFLHSLQFYARSGDQQTLFAQKDNIDQLGLSAPNPTLKLDVPHAELQPYVTAPSMSIVVQGTGHYPPKETRLKANVKLRVEAKVF